MSKWTNPPLQEQQPRDKLMASIFDFMRSQIAKMDPFFATPYFDYLSHLGGRMESFVVTAITNPSGIPKEIEEIVNTIFLEAYTKKD